MVLGNYVEPKWHWEGNVKYRGNVIRVKSLSDSCSPLKNLTNARTFFCLTLRRNGQKATLPLLWTSSWRPVLSYKNGLKIYWLYWCLMHLSWIFDTHGHTTSFLIKCRPFERRSKQIPSLLLPGRLYVLCEYWSSAGRIAWFNQPRHCLAKALYFVQCHVSAASGWSSVIFQNRGSGLAKSTCAWRVSNYK